MVRNAFAALACLILLAGSATAQDWANKMFLTPTSHDFGTVARGSKQEFRFKFQNKYVEDVHVAGVRTSCGCTTPTVTKSDLKTWETSEIVAKFNTHLFTGYRSATVTVTFDKPFYAEVQLQVRGNIRGDIVVEPGLVSFGSVEQGQASQAKISIVHAGSPNWKIVDVRSANDHLEVEVFPTRKTYSEVGYDLLVRLKKDAPAGYLKDQLFLVTNDPNAQQFPVDVEGRIVAALTVSPSSLAFGTLQPGEKATKNIVVRGKSPFKITNITTDTPESLSYQVPTEAREIHLIPITFTAGSAAGKVSQKLVIETELGKSEVLAQAQVEGSAAVPVVADQR